MLHASRVLGKAIDALDGDIGSVHDLYFDDRTWTARYLVVDTGKWLPGKQVLVVPDVIVKPWHEEGAIPVHLTKAQIQSSPEIDAAKPMSRVAEDLLHRHYGWTPYWDTTSLPLPPPPPPDRVAVTTVEERQEAQAEAEAVADVSLRSAREIAGYRLHASDGDIGHVDDLLLDDDCRRILFFVIEVKALLFGKKVLAPVSLVSQVDWATSTIHVDAHREGLKGAQEYNSAA